MRVSEAAGGNSTVTLGVQPSPQLQEQVFRCPRHSGELPLSRCQEASPDSTGMKKPQKAKENPLTFHPPVPKLYVSNLQKLLQLGKQGGSLWVGLGFGCAGTQGHSLHSLRDVLVRICFRSHWCRPGALPVLAHQFLAVRACSPRHLISLSCWSLPWHRDEEHGQAFQPWGLWKPGRDGHWWLCTPQPDLLWALGSVQWTQSCPGLSWKGWSNTC